MPSAVSVQVLVQVEKGEIGVEAPARWCPSRCARPMRGCRILWLTELGDTLQRQPALVVPLTDEDGQRASRGPGSPGEAAQIPARLRRDVAVDVVRRDWCRRRRRTGPAHKRFAIDGLPQRRVDLAVGPRRPSRCRVSGNAGRSRGCTVAPGSRAGAAPPRALPTTTCGRRRAGARPLSDVGGALPASASTKGGRLAFQVARPRGRQDRPPWPGRA